MAMKKKAKGASRERTKVCSPGLPTLSVLETHSGVRNEVSDDSILSTNHDGASEGGSTSEALVKGSQMRLPMMSHDELFRYRASYMKEDPLSLTAVIDEFLGEGQFQDYPIKNGISGLMATVRRNERSYNSGMSGKDYPRHKTVICLVKRIQEEVIIKGVPQQTIVERLDKERLTHSRPEDPFAWTFLANYAGCKYEWSAFARGVLLRENFPEFDGAKFKRRRLSRTAKTNGKYISYKSEGDPPKPFIPANFFPANTPYIEELGLIYHDPPENVNLTPLPPPPPVPPIPVDLVPRWRYDEWDNRILRANFKGLLAIPPKDKDFMQQVMQCDHIVLVCDGLLEIDPSSSDSFLWTRGQIAAEMGRDNVYHKFRRFRKQGESQAYEELDGYLSMRVSDYMLYLNQREVADQRDLNGDEGDQGPVSFAYKCYCEPCLKSNGGDCPGHVLDDVRTEAIYMTDVELPTYSHRLHESFNRSFKLPQVIPGGPWCIMSSMPPSTRPFMGPNLYMSPPGGFTHLHQDGHGSVDSGHLCIDGYNEVLIMRRLPERHKMHAVEVMNRIVGGKFSPLYNLPHDDKNEKPRWMTMQVIRKWEEMNYVPIRLVLEPGQYIHLNKGRLHAFRKGTRDALGKDDCHYELRKRYTKQLKTMAAPICVSIAWDWNYYGYDANGINREVASMLEAAHLCRRKRVKALAPAGRAVLGMSFYLVDSLIAQEKLLSSPEVTVRSPDKRSQIVARGMIPSLTFLKHREVSSYVRAENASAERRKMFLNRQTRGYHLTQALVPDTCKDPLKSSIDALGNDYYCKLCETELVNVYFRCDGCEFILQKDYMICTDCFVEGAFMHGPASSDSSSLVHTGFLSGQCRGSCRKNDCISCSACGFGSCCSCRCHSNFTMHMRLAMPNQVARLLASIRQIAAGDPVDYGDETIARLKYTCEPRGTAHREFCQLVLAKDATNCVNVPD